MIIYIYQKQQQKNILAEIRYVQTKEFKTYVFIPNMYLFLTQGNACICFQ